MSENWRGCGCLPRGGPWWDGSFPLLRAQLSSLDPEILVFTSCLQPVVTAHPSREQPLWSLLLFGVLVLFVFWGGGLFIC